jgi:hypothetical protein
VPVCDLQQTGRRGPGPGHLELAAEIGRQLFAGAVEGSRGVLVEDLLVLGVDPAQARGP